MFMGNDSETIKREYYSIISLISRTKSFDLFIMTQFFGRLFQIVFSCFQGIRPRYQIFHQNYIIFSACVVQEGISSEI